MQFQLIPLLPWKSRNMINPQECSSRTNLHVIIWTKKVLKKAFPSMMSQLLQMMSQVRMVRITMELSSMKWNRFVLIRASIRMRGKGKLTWLITRAITLVSLTRTSLRARHLCLVMTFTSQFTNYIDLSHCHGIIGGQVHNCMVRKLPWILALLNNHHQL